MTVPGEQTDQDGKTGAEGDSCRWYQVSVDGNP